MRPREPRRADFAKGHSDEVCDSYSDEHEVRGALFLQSRADL